MRSIVKAHLIRRHEEGGFFVIEEETEMNWIVYLMVGGFMKGYRTQVLGVLGFVTVVAHWAVGDMSTADLINHLPGMLGSLAFTALGAKVNSAAEIGSVK